MMLVIGSGINYASFTQTDLIKDSARSYSFINYFPKVTFRYNQSQQKRFSLSYNGRTNPPRMDQLQPVRENTDPLNIQIGNPDLRQEFVHNMNISFHDFKILSNRGVYIWAGTTFTQNAISNSSTVDAGGKTVHQAINVNGNYNFNMSGGYNYKLKKSDIYIYGGPNINYSRIHNIVNNLPNRNDYRMYTLRMGVSKYVNEKMSFWVSPNIGYTYSTSSLRPDIITKYFTSETEFNFWKKLPKKFEVYTAAYINLRQKTDVFDKNRNAIKWDANVSRKFFKNNSLELKLAVFDILNQNIGFSRMANSNFITENNYVTLRRFALLSVQYNISKNP
jgi:hypothetical protein